MITYLMIFTNPSFKNIDFDLYLSKFHHKDKKPILPFRKKKLFPSWREGGHFVTQWGGTQTNNRHIMVDLQQFPEVESLCQGHNRTPGDSGQWLHHWRELPTSEVSIHCHTTCSAGTHTTTGLLMNFLLRLNNSWKMKHTNIIVNVLATPSRDMHWRV